eukprot:gene29645-38770_t
MKYPGSNTVVVQVLISSQSNEYSSTNGSSVCNLCSVGQSALFPGSKKCTPCGSLYSGLGCFDSGFINVGCFAYGNSSSIASASIPGGTISDIHSACEQYALGNTYPLINYRNNKCDFSQRKSTLMARSLGCQSSSSPIRAVFAYASLGYVSVGCFASPIPTSLQLIPLSPSPNSDVKAVVDNCATAAKTKGYSLFAMSGSGSCYGGVDISSATENVYSSGCGMLGDQTSNSYQVYVNPDIAYTRLGCLNGFDPNTISSSFVLSEGTASYDVNSCGAMAVVQFNRLFGFSTSGSVCFVGNESAQVVTPAYSQDCNSPGSIKVYVQTVSLPETSPQSLYQNIGCYRDNSTRMIHTYQSYPSTPVECALKAENAEATVFGLQAGGQCFTGDSVSSAISLSSVSNCPLLGSSWANQVFVRKYCFPGWTTVSSYTGNVFTFACRKCSKGFYCPGDNNEVPCDMDYSTEDMEGASECTACDTANGYSTIGLTGQLLCKPIPVGYYLINNNTTLKYCGTNNKTQHWIGGGYNKRTCRCAPHWTGDQCDIPTCPDQLPFFSLGTLLFNSDSTLLQA